MLRWLLTSLSENFFILNIFSYITVRTICAVLTALSLNFIIGAKIIAWLASKQKDGQPVRKDIPKFDTLSKKKTPTMGGILILITTMASILLWSDLSNTYVIITCLALLGFGAIGAFDDYQKLTKKSSNGISVNIKISTQTVIAALISIWIIYLLPSEQSLILNMPFFKDFSLNFGYLFVIFAILVIVGSSNAVNLTDGLDGLAIAPVIICTTCFCIITYIVGHVEFAKYLHIPYVPGTSELATVCGAIIGAGLGFLWFNAPPAMVFMGDTGSLALGGMLGTLAVITKHEIVLFIIGGLFVLETASVMIQILYCKITKGKRIFLMAPIHHHFEKKGWSESTIIIRFWIISIVLALIGMITLKIR